MPSWGDLLGSGSVAEQLLIWQVGAQVISELLGPVFEVVRQRVNSLAPEYVLSPAELAEALVRNFTDLASAESEAAKSGINPERLAILKALAGDAPAPFQLAEALRRKIIEEGGTGAESTSFDQGIAEGRLGNKWGPVIKALGVQWPTPNDALEALLEGQVDEATAKDLYQRFGGDLAFFQMLYDTRGNAPTPMEALEMANRKIIPRTGRGPDSVSYEQAFLEGPWRNKWLGPFEQLGRYVPPPRTVVALLRSGSITPDQAASYFQDAGMSPELAGQYVHSATAEKLAGTRHLAESTVLELYQVQALTKAEAEAHLAALGYAPDDVGLVLEVSDLQRELRLVNSVVNRAGAMYVGRKITRQAAEEALKALHLAPTHIEHLLTDWGIERAASVRQLTPAQIEAAWFYEVITEAEALALLEDIGYTPYDAWVALSVRGKAPQADKPAKGPGGPGLLP